METWYRGNRIVTENGETHRDIYIVLDTEAVFSKPFFPPNNLVSTEHGFYLPVKIKIGGTSDLPVHVCGNTPVN